VQDPSFVLARCRRASQRELAKSLTRATQPGPVSPGGGEQAQTAPAGEPFIRVRGKSSPCRMLLHHCGWGSRKARGDAESLQRALSLSLSLSLSHTHTHTDSLACQGCCLLLQYLIQSCARGGTHSARACMNCLLLPRCICFLPFLDLFIRGGVIQICRISRPIYSGIRKYRSRP